jgi:hypothetical protein
MIYILYIYIYISYIYISYIYIYIIKALDIKKILFLDLIDACTSLTDMVNLLIL